MRVECLAGFRCVRPVGWRRQRRPFQLGWRPLPASMSVALDGVVEPAISNWPFPYFNDKMGTAVDGIHDAESPSRLGDMRKVVRLAPAARVHLARLRTVAGRPRGGSRHTQAPRRIAFGGSVTVVRQLLAAELLDEQHLFVHSVPGRLGAWLEGLRRRYPRAAALPAVIAAVRPRRALCGVRAGPEPADGRRRADQGRPSPGMTYRRAREQATRPPGPGPDVNGSLPIGRHHRAPPAAVIDADPKPTSRPLWLRSWRPAFRHSSAIQHTKSVPAHTGRRPLANGSVGSKLTGSCRPQRS